MRAGRGLQRDRVHAGDFDQALAQRLDDAQRALRNLLRLVGMSVGQAFEARDHFVHARVVLHGARAQRIHAEIDGVVPGGKPGEVADDFDLADFGHVAQVFSFAMSPRSLAVSTSGTSSGGSFHAAFPGRRLLEDQAFVLVDVPGGLRSFFIVPPPALGFFTGRAPNARFPHQPTAVSIALRVVSSVQHHKRCIAQFGIELFQREAADDLVSQQPAVDGVADLRWSGPRIR